MKNLLYKEFRLAIHPLFYLVSLLGALILIPNWFYFIALSYVFFITISNIFTACKAQNDIGFSVMMPVRKKDIVKARVISIVCIELLHILVAVIFALVNKAIYSQNHMFLDPNVAFFGFGFIMYALFNVIFLPMFYKTGYKIGIPVILATLAAVAFATGVELFVMFVPWANFALDSANSSMSIWKIAVLISGILIYVLSAIVSYKISARRFEKIDL